MKLAIWLLIIVLIPAVLALGISWLVGIERSKWVFLIGNGIGPAIAFLCGLASMAYFLSLPPDTSHGGDGPAFFAILAIMYILPVALLVPGILSGFLAEFLFRRMNKSRAR